MQVFHYTSNLDQILASGEIQPGYVAHQGERLRFVMVSRSKPPIRIGGPAVIQLELDENDPALHAVNSDWLEYYGSIPVTAITGVARPPESLAAAVADLPAEGRVRAQTFAHIDNLCEIKPLADLR